MKLNLEEIQNIKICLYMCKNSKTIFNPKPSVLKNLENLHEKFSSFLKEEQSKVNCEINVKTDRKI